MWARIMRNMHSHTITEGTPFVQGNLEISFKFYVSTLFLLLLLSPLFLLANLAGKKELIVFFFFNEMLFLKKIIF